MKSLILYFSRAAENYFGGVLKYIEKGNTEVVAEKLAVLTDGDLFKIEPKVPYSDVYNICIEQAKQDQRSNARPEVATMPADMAQYDTVFVLFPNYWGSMSMHMFTVLEQLDLIGKTIRPICTHEGSRMGNSERDLKKICIGAAVEPGLAICGSNVYECEKTLKKWL
ncbi:MAG: flavodoxin [Lachnospiraceae bacterium]|nr:flavodoxin [Lachnospiraceae bacterium]